MNIIYSDIVIYDNIPFEEYLLIPSHSFSSLKSQFNGVNKYVNFSQKMQLGKIVDALLTENGYVDMKNDLYPVALKIANEIRLNFGSIIDKFNTQSSYSAIMGYQGLEISIKGRTDYDIKNLITLDLKVSNTKIKDIPTLVTHMGYKNQLWNYANLNKSKKEFLLIYSTKDNKPILYDITSQDKYYNEFWADKILMNGTVKN